MLVHTFLKVYYHIIDISGKHMRATDPIQWDYLELFPFKMKIPLFYLNIRKI